MLIDSLFGELKKIMLSLEVKYKYLGEKRDTTETRYVADRFIGAIEETDTFYSYPTFSVEAIKKSGLTLDDEQAAMYALKPTSIPTEYREIVLKEHRKVIISTYEDGNDYYRMLSGLPNVGDGGHYATVDFYEMYEIEFKAVHEFTNIEVMQLMASGEMKLMHEMYSDQKYLHYLGSNKIDPYVSRKAANFQVIKSSYVDDSELLDRFLTIYDQNREYISSIVYVNEYSNTKDYYDNYMALNILVMTVQRVIVDVFKGAIAREFYDISLIKVLLECYNVPFIENLPLEYQKLLVKNLNKLLHYKSTDKVLFDVADLLGFDQSKIFKYYLVKNHKFDQNGKPIFEYKTDETGKLVENVDVMYDVYFQTVDITEENEEFALKDRTNRVEYNEVVSDDPFWYVDDKELMEKLYDTEFNYIETKYLHMNIMFKLTEMMFEIVHVYRILQDKRSQTMNLEIGLPKIISSRKINLFTYTIFMCAAIAKRNKLSGEIISSPSKTLYLMGFDFTKDFNEIKKVLEENKKYVDADKIASYIYYTDMYSHQEVDQLFNNVRALWEFLSLSLKNARTIEEYRAYEKLYRALYVTQDMDHIFKTPQGDVATTYLELLKSWDFELFTALDKADDNKIFEYLNHGIEAIKNIITDTKYLNGMVDTNNVIMTALIRLIKFFKSYTVDLRDFNVIYVLDHPYLHALKIIDQVKRMEGDITIHDKTLRDHLTEFVNVASEMRKDELVRLYEELQMESTMSIKMVLLGIIKMTLESEITIKDNMEYLDTLMIMSEIHKSDELLFDDLVDYISSFELKEDLFKNLKAYMESTISTSDKVDYMDVVHIMKLLFSKEGMDFKHTQILLVAMRNSIKLFGSVDGYLEASILSGEKNQMVEFISIIKDLCKYDSVRLHDESTLISELGIEMKPLLTIKGYTEADISLPEKFSVFESVGNNKALFKKNTVSFSEGISNVKEFNISERASLNDRILSEVLVNINARMTYIDHVDVDKHISSRSDVKVREQINIIREIVE